MNIKSVLKQEQAADYPYAVLMVSIGIRPKGLSIRGRGAENC